MDQVPRELLEAVANLRLPTKTDQRLQALMDRNNNGQLNPSEREELEAIVEWSENISLLRARALQVLGRSPV
jgi:hypothetical protein